MKVKYLNIALIFVIILSIVINFNSFLMGRASSLSNIVYSFPPVSSVRFAFDSASTSAIVLDSGSISLDCIE